MEFNIKMPQLLKPYFNEELIAYQKEYQHHNLKRAFNHLERAHVIGQKYPYEHSLVHWKMLLFGFKIKNTKEIIGQIPRLLVGGVKSFVGKIPEGNTGGANIPALQSFAITEDIQEIFRKAKV